MTQIPEEANFCPVTQPWMHRIPLMQQSVLLSAIRGPDGLHKNHPSKLICRWLRRCILLGSFDKSAYLRPFDYMVPRGGSFTGPSIGPSSPLLKHAKIRRVPDSLGPIYPIGADPFSGRQIDQEIIAHWEERWPREMHYVLDTYLRCVDEMPQHFQLHIMHAAEVLGYQHYLPEVRNWWYECYLRMVDYMHLHPESEEEMNIRLGDSELRWRDRETVADTFDAGGKGAS